MLVANSCTGKQANFVTVTTHKLADRGFCHYDHPEACSAGSAWQAVQLTRRQAAEDGAWA